MKTTKKAFHSLSLATIIFCAASTTALAGQYSFSHNTSHGSGHSGNIEYRNLQQINTNHNSTSGRYQTGYTGAQASRGYGGNGRVQTNNTGINGRVQSGSTRQTHGTRHHQVFGF